MLPYEGKYDTKHYILRDEESFAAWALAMSENHTNIYISRHKLFNVVTASQMTLVHRFVTDNHISIQETVTVCIIDSRKRDLWIFKKSLLVTGKGAKNVLSFGVTETSIPLVVGCNLSKNSFENTTSHFPFLTLVQKDVILTIKRMIFSDHVSGFFLSWYRQITICSSRLNILQDNRNTSVASTLSGIFWD